MAAAAREVFPLGTPVIRESDIHYVNYGIPVLRAPSHQSQADSGQLRACVPLQEPDWSRKEGCWYQQTMSRLDVSLVVRGVCRESCSLDLCPTMVVNVVAIEIVLRPEPWMGCPNPVQDFVHANPEPLNLLAGHPFLDARRLSANVRGHLPVTAGPGFFNPCCHLCRGVGRNSHVTTDEIAQVLSHQSRNRRVKCCGANASHPVGSFVNRYRDMFHW